MLKISFATLLLTTTLSACAAIQSGTSKPDAVAAALGEKEIYTSINGLLEVQSKDMARRMGWEDDAAQPFEDYDVVVYHGGPAIGSLLQGVRGNLINRSACVTSNVAEVDINAFGSHTLDTRNAIKIGIIPTLPFGFSGGISNTTSYSLQDAKLQLLDADELEQIVASPVCAARIAKAEGPVWIVRGVIKAKRSYKFYRSINASVTLKGAESPSTGEGVGTGVGEVTDSAARPYFLVLSQVKTKKQSTLANPDTTAQCSTNFSNQIYIQRSTLEPEETGIKVRSALLSYFNVENHIQAVDVTPKIADVRYYNDNDLSAALCAVAILRQNGYPNAKTNPRKSLKPPKTLEIWLPRKPVN